MGLFIRYLIQLIMAPGAGWEDISKADKPTNVWLSTGFYPLLGIASLSSFMSLFYQTDATFGHCLISALTIFISYFATYFIAGLVFSYSLAKFVTLPDNSDLSRTGALARFNIVAMFSLSIMTLITLIENLLPFENPITKFLFVYVIFILYRGADFAGVPEERAGLFTLVGFGCVFIPPFAISAWLSLFF